MDGAHAVVQGVDSLSPASLALLWWSKVRIPAHVVTIREPNNSGNE